MSNPIIYTSDGPIRGLWQADGIAAFHGVPFAKPPTGDLRWKSPVRPEQWKSARDATQRGPPCYQEDVVRGVGRGSEDCLYLSLYSPSQCIANNARSSPCAVMFWVHGGAWLLGDDIGRGGGYNGSTLAMLHGVIVIAVNYRLDALGWLALREFASESPDGKGIGNFGLRDQRFGLQWAQRNVAAFGGDPDRVTLFGQSAGAFSVCQHLVSPDSNRLFSRVIMMSGACNGPWLVQPRDEYSAFGSEYASAIGCPATDDPAPRLACLRSKSTADVLLPWVDFLCSRKSSPGDPWCPDNRTAARRSARRSSFTLAGGGSSGSPSAWPSSLARPPPLGALGLTAVVDGSSSGLPASPLKMMRDGRINTSPSGAPLQVIMGTVEDELALFIVGVGAIFRNATVPPTAADIRIGAKQLAEYHAGWNDSTVDAITRQYVTRLPLETNAYRLTRLGTGVVFRCATRDAARALSAAGVSVHLYSFEFRLPKWHDPKSQRCQLLCEVGCGVYHAIDIPFAWGHIDESSEGSAALAVSKGIMSYYTNLAVTGDPNGAAGAAGVPVQWPAYDGTTDRHLAIGGDGAFRTSHGLGKQECDFWAGLPPNPW